MKEHFGRFLSTPSARRATAERTTPPAGYQFLSTPSARRATFCSVSYFCSPAISIHALREEGDVAAEVKAATYDIFLSTPSARRATVSRSFRGGRNRDFYPRPPRGGRPFALSQLAGFGVFLSTPSARRATWTHRAIVRSFKFLSTPSARRATAKTETKSLFSNKLYNILHEFRRALIYNGSKSYPNHAK